MLNNRGIYDQVKATEAYLRHFQSYMMKLYPRCLTAKYLTGLCLSYLSVQRKTDIKKVSDNLSHLLLSDKCYSLLLQKEQLPRDVPENKHS